MTAIGQSARRGSARPALKRVISSLLALGLAAILASAPIVLDDFLLKTLTRILILGLAALAVDLVLGHAGLVSLGHAAFVAVGAYVTGILTDAGWNSAILVWPLAALAAAMLAVLVGALSLRSTGLYFIMITLAFAQMVYYGLQSLGAYGGDDGFAVTRNTLGSLDLYDNERFYYLTLSLCAIVALIVRRVVRSQFGIVLQASRDNPGRVLALGLSPFGYRLVAFGLSGAIAGLSGALLANLSAYVVPSLASWQLSGELLVMVLIGSSGSILGPFVGAFVFLGLSELLSDVTGHWMFYLGILIVLRAVLPGSKSAAALISRWSHR